VTCWVVIPTKAPAQAKGRLATALDSDQRGALAEAMLDRAVKAVSAARVSGGLALVGTSRMGQPRTQELLTDPGGGLNAAVHSARDALAARGATRLITLAADLPLLEYGDVAALCELPAGVIGIAPDRHGTGTNALSLPLPEALDFAYSYGIGSCALHKAEAKRLGLPIALIASPGLARDIDEPADLADAGDLLTKGREQP